MMTPTRAVFSALAVLSGTLSLLALPASATSNAAKSAVAEDNANESGFVEQVLRGEFAAAQPGATQANMPFVAVAPRRLMDSRSGVGVARAKLSPNLAYKLQVTGPGTGNADVATAVTLNVTAVSPSDNGFVTVWPCDASTPNTSNLNFAAGQTIPNAVITRISSEGTICLQTSAATHLLVDSSGWFPAGSYLQPKVPDRAIDTRNTTVLAANTPLEVAITGTFDVPATASASLLNVTATGTTGSGFLTVYPCGQAVPDTSNLNFGGGQTVANLVLASAGAAGKTCIVSSVTTNVIVDIMAWLPAAADIHGQVPARILDTRRARPYAGPVGMIQANEVLRIPLRTTPTGPVLPFQGAFLNVTAAGPTKGGYMTVWRCSDARPNTSNLNFAEGVDTANLVVTASDGSGEVCVFSDTAAWLIIDINGFYAPDAPHALPFATTTASALPNTTVTPTTPQAAPATQARDYDSRRVDAFPRGPWGYLTAAQTPSFIGQLIITAADGNHYRCSGTVVDRDVILTAGHCVLDDPISSSVADLPQKATKVVFTPGLYGSAGLGSWSTASADDIHPSPGYASDLRNDTPPVKVMDNTANDWALVRLAVDGSGRHVGDVAGMVPVRPDLGRSPLTKVTVHYPAAGFFSAHCAGTSCMPMFCVSPNPPVYRTESFATNGGNYAVGNGCPLMNGSSGAGVFSYLDGRWWTVSVVSRGGDRAITGDPAAADESDAAYAVATVGPELNSNSYPALLAVAKA